MRQKIAKCLGYRISSRNGFGPDRVDGYECECARACAEWISPGFTIGILAHLCQNNFKLMVDNRSHISPKTHHWSVSSIYTYLYRMMNMMNSNGSNWFFVVRRAHAPHVMGPLRRAKKLLRHRSAINHNQPHTHLKNQQPFLRTFVRSALLLGPGNGACAVSVVAAAAARRAMKKTLSATSWQLLMLLRVFSCALSECSLPAGLFDEMDTYSRLAHGTHWPIMGWTVICRVVCNSYMHCIYMARIANGTLCCMQCVDLTVSRLSLSLTRLFDLS